MSTHACVDTHEIPSPGNVSCVMYVVIVSLVVELGSGCVHPVVYMCMRMYSIHIHNYLCMYVGMLVQSSIDQTTLCVPFFLITNQVARPVRL